ncbi:MAG: hypothetical protein WCO10_00495 [bacterium]
MNRIRKEIERRQLSIGDALLLQQRSHDEIMSVQRSYNWAVMRYELGCALDDLHELLFGWMVGHEKELTTLVLALGFAAIVMTMVLKPLL